VERSTRPALPSGLGNTSRSKLLTLLPFASRFGRPHTRTWLARSLADYLHSCAAN